MGNKSCSHQGRIRHLIHPYICRFALTTFWHQLARTVCFIQGNSMWSLMLSRMGPSHVFIFLLCLWLIFSPHAQNLYWARNLNIKTLHAAWGNYKFCLLTFKPIPSDRDLLMSAPIACSSDTLIIHRPSSSRPHHLDHTISTTPSHHSSALFISRLDHQPVVNTQRLACTESGHGWICRNNNYSSAFLQSQRPTKTKFLLLYSTNLRSRSRSNRCLFAAVCVEQLPRCINRSGKPRRPSLGGAVERNLSTPSVNSDSLNQLLTLARLLFRWNILCCHALQIDIAVNKYTPRNNLTASRSQASPPPCLASPIPPLPKPPPPHFTTLQYKPSISRCWRRRHYIVDFSRSAFGRGDPTLDRAIIRWDVRYLTQIDDLKSHLIDVKTTHSEVQQTRILIRVIITKRNK